jgi:hypothetical protein
LFFAFLPHNRTDVGHIRGRPDADSYLKNRFGRLQECRIDMRTPSQGAKGGEMGVRGVLIY